MSVTATVKPRGQLFPENTAVEAVLKRLSDVERREGRAPAPAPEATGVISEGKVELAGLEADKDYILTGFVDEVQVLTVKAKKGKIKWTFEGQTGAALKFDASAAELEANLEALSNVAAGDVKVTGGPGDETGSTPYKVKFLKAWAGTNVAAITASTSELEETPKTVEISTETQGSKAGSGGIQRTCLFRSPAE